MKSEMKIWRKRNMNKDMRQRIVNYYCRGWFGLVREWNVKKGIVKVADWRQILKFDCRKYLFCLWSL